ncbi:hypothetical protein CerSpe_181880 [Prunus speciosa]
MTEFHFRLTQGPEEGTKRDFTKLMKMGFEYKYGMKDVLDDSVACGRLFIWSSFSQCKAGSANQTLADPVDFNSCDEKNDM